MLDADGSTDPEEIPAFVRALLDGADFAKGSRFVAGGGSADITPIRKVGNRVPRHGPSTPVRRPLHRPLLRLQRVLGRSLPRSMLDLRRLRGRDADQRPGRRAGLAVAEVPASSTSGSTAEQAAPRARRPARAPHDPARAVAPRTPQRVTPAPAFRELEQASGSGTSLVASS